MSSLSVGDTTRRKAAKRNRIGLGQQGDAPKSLGGLDGGSLAVDLSASEARTMEEQVSNETVTAEELCVRGRTHYAEGRLDGALDCFEQAHALGALKPDDLIFKLRAEYRLGKKDEALATIQRILAVQPRQSEALKTGGRIANAMQDAALAKDFWQRLADADPSDPDGPLQMARITFRDSAFTDASLWGRRLLAITPSHPEGLAIASSCGVRLDLGGTGELLASYIEVDRARAMALLHQLSRTGDPQNYAEALVAVREHLPEDAEVAKLIADACEYFIVSGLQAEIQSRDVDAARFYRGIRRLDSASANAEKGLERLRRYGVIKMREGFRLKNVDQVIEYGRKVVEIDPDCFEAWITLGRSYFQRAAFGDARDCFGKCVELNADDPWAWLNYARSLDKANEWAGALIAFRRVISFGASTSADHLTESERAIRALYAKALFAGRDAARDGDIQRAWKHCAVAIDIDPGNENVAVLKRQLLNHMHARIRELWQAGAAEAIDVSRQYLVREPNDTYVLQVFGRSLMNNRRFSEALPAWERLAELQPEDAHFRLQIARCCNWMKQRAEGLAAVRETLRLDPNMIEAKAIQQQLEALPDLTS
jgi:tetratricopeptide (TPR) repeat protein